MPTSGPDKSGHIKRVGILTRLFCVVNDQFGTEKSGHNKRVGILTSGHINRSLLYLLVNGAAFSINNGINQKLQHLLLGQTWNLGFDQSAEQLQHRHLKPIIIK